MRICVVNATAALGGAGLVAKDIASGMVQRGHDVRFVCTGPAEDLASEPYEVVSVSAGAQTPLDQYFNPVALLGLRRALRDFSPDVVSLHNINLRSFSAAAVLVPEVPTYWTLHDVWPVCVTGWPMPPDCEGMHRNCTDCPSWPNWQARANRVVKEAIFTRSRVMTVCPSEWMQRTIARSALGVRPSVVVRNGVDTALFAPRTPDRAALGIADDAKVILFVGGKRLQGNLPAERKGWRYLQAALTSLAGTISGLTLLYVGDAPPEVDLPVTVVATGGVPRTAMPDLYAAADVVVMPTLGDNAPLGLLEAMACGKCVVATDTGGIPEVISDGVSGLIVPRRSGPALASALQRALRDPEWADGMGLVAKAKTDGALSMATMMDGYERVFVRGLS